MKNVLSRALLTALIGLVACDASQSLVVPTQPPVVTPPATSPFLVSNTVSGSGVEATSLVFVSLPSGSLPTGQTVDLTTESGATTRVLVVDGGFDPVAVQAHVGEAIKAVVNTTSANHLDYSMPVPARAAPVVVRTNPKRSTSNVATDEPILVVFSEPVYAAAVNPGKIQVRNEAGVIDGRLTFSDANHTTVKFTPNTKLQAFASYSLIVTEGIWDLDYTNILSAVTVSFTTGAEVVPPVTPPTPPAPGAQPFAVARIVPSPEQADVPVDQDIQVWFTTPLHLGSLYGSTYLITPPDNARIYLHLANVFVDATLTCVAFRDAGCMSVRLHPALPLKHGAVYLLEVARGLMSTSELNLSSAVTLRFSTEDVPAAASPALLEPVSFQMFEFWDSWTEEWVYAPLIRVRESGGAAPANVVRIELSMPDVPGVKAYCSAGTYVAQGTEHDLFYGLFGSTSEGSFYMPDGKRSPPGEAIAIITYRDRGRLDSITLRAQITPGPQDPPAYRTGHFHGYQTGPSCLPNGNAQ